MWDKFNEFLHNEKTIVAGFNFQSDAWAFHLTFGKQRFPFAIYNNMTRKEKASYRSLNIFKDLRVFDLQNVIQAVKNNQPGYQAEDWISLGIRPEGNTLWHLSQTVLCLDLVGNDTSDVFGINEFWNVKILDSRQMKYIEIDSQVAILTFMALLRYGLIPEASELLRCFPHDIRKPQSFKEDLNRWIKEKITPDRMAKEIAEVINHREGLISMSNKLKQLCLATAKGPLMNNLDTKYRTLWLPTIYLTKNQKTKPETDYEDWDSDTEDDAKNVDQTKKTIEPAKTIKYHPETAMNIREVPGAVPFFISATHPRSKLECDEHLARTQALISKLVSEKWQGAADKVQYVNWLDTKIQGQLKN